MTRSRFLAGAAAALVTTRLRSPPRWPRPSRGPSRCGSGCRPRWATSCWSSIPAKAPGTTANFLRYVDAGHYDGGTFHRTVKMDNQPESTVKIEVIQAGVTAKVEVRLPAPSRSSAPASPG